MFQLLLAAAFALAGNLLQKPEALCARLREEGLPVGSWRPVSAPPTHLAAAPVPYSCETPLLAPSPVIPGLRTAGADVVRIWGDTASRVDSITIAVAVSPGQESAAKEQLRKIVRSLFKALEQRPPDGLSAAIEGERRFLARRPYGLISFSSSRGSQHVLWLRLRPRVPSD